MSKDTLERLLTMRESMSDKKKRYSSLGNPNPSYTPYRSGYTDTHFFATNKIAQEAIGFQNQAPVNIRGDSSL